MGLFSGGEESEVQYLRRVNDEQRAHIRDLEKTLAELAQPTINARLAYANRPPAPPKDDAGAGVVRRRVFSPSRLRDQMEDRPGRAEDLTERSAEDLRRRLLSPEEVDARFKMPTESSSG